jgi:hypothetical protein
MKGFFVKPRNRSLKAMSPGRILDHIEVDQGLLKRRFISLRRAIPGEPPPRNHESANNGTCPTAVQYMNIKR